MLGALLKNITSRKKRRAPATPLRLHIGGKSRHPGWHVLDVVPGEHVDFVGSCVDLSQFRDGSVAEIYASHVLEHLGYQKDLPRALSEFRRVLAPGGSVRLSVPDLQTLCELFLDPARSAQERFHVMRMMFGGQLDDADFHHVGLTEQFLSEYLKRAGFVDIMRVADLQGFDDTSRLVYGGRAISLSMVAHAPQAPGG
jgi:predicted SAM-dependent methyltransferase